MSDFDTIDYFMDPSLVDDPFPYFEHLRAKGPVVPLPHHGVVAVTGYDAAAAIWRDTETFSSCNTVTGPFPGLPVKPEGDDIRDLIEQHRGAMPMAGYLVTADPPSHTALRALLMRLLTPKRLEENEAFMWRLADLQIDHVFKRNTFEVLNDFAQPFAMLVITDLLGVPDEDRRGFAAQLGVEQPGPKVGDTDRKVSLDPLAFLNETFTAYVEDRRRAPRQDVLTRLATATFPDGSLAAGDRRRAHRDVPLRRRAGHDRTAHHRSAAVCSATIPRSRRSCGASASASPTSSRRCCACTVPSRRSRVWLACARRSLASTSRPAPPS